MTRVLAQVPIVVHDANGLNYEAWRLVCPCGSAVFRIMRMEGQNHGHFTCVYCDSVWCGSFDNKQCDKSGLVPLNKQ